jgi:hypothetical protein
MAGAAATYVDNLCLAGSTTALSLAMKARVVTATFASLRDATVVMCRKTSCAVTRMFDEAAVSHTSLMMASQLSRTGSACSNVPAAVDELSTVGSTTASGRATHKTPGRRIVHGRLTLFPIVLVVRHPSPISQESFDLRAKIPYRTARKHVERRSIAGTHVSNRAIKGIVCHAYESFLLLVVADAPVLPLFVIKAMRNPLNACVSAVFL